MNKELTAILVIGLCLGTTLVFADQNYEERNIFNKITDWSTTLGKSSEEKQAVIDQRIATRSEKRKSYDAYNKEKRELTEQYHNELLSIKDNSNYSAEVMAQRINESNNDYRMKLKQLAESRNADHVSANYRDRIAEEVTAGQQGQDKNDLKITQTIRKAITEEKSFSMDAHNVKIITQNGAVTLKGPVKSNNEREMIQAIAYRAVGMNNVHNEMVIN